MKDEPIPWSYFTNLGYIVDTYCWGTACAELQLEELFMDIFAIREQISLILEIWITKLIYV